MDGGENSEFGIRNSEFSIAGTSWPEILKLKSDIGESFCAFPQLAEAQRGLNCSRYAGTWVRCHSEFRIPNSEFFPCRRPVRAINHLVGAGAIAAIQAISRSAKG